MASRIPLRPSQNVIDDLIMVFNVRRRKFPHETYNTAVKNAVKVAFDTGRIPQGSRHSPEALERIVVAELTKVAEQILGRPVSSNGNRSPQRKKPLLKKERYINLLR